MADRFIPLREFLFEASEPEIAYVEPIAAPIVEEAQPHAREALGELRRFRAAVRDAVDVAARGVLCDVAADVLARELALAPANVEAIVARACARHARDGVARVRVHPDEAAPVAEAGLEVVADASLRRGDVVLEVRSGTIDVTLGARLACVLDDIES